MVEHTHAHSPTSHRCIAYSVFALIFLRALKHTHTHRHARAHAHTPTWVGLVPILWRSTCAAAVAVAVVAAAAVAVAVVAVVAAVAAAMMAAAAVTAAAVAGACGTQALRVVGCAALRPRPHFGRHTPHTPDHNPLTCSSLIPGPPPSPPPSLPYTGKRPFDNRSLLHLGLHWLGSCHLPSLRPLPPTSPALHPPPTL